MITLHVDDPHPLTIFAIGTAVIDCNDDFDKVLPLSRNYIGILADHSLDLIATSQH